MSRTASARARPTSSDSDPPPLAIPDEIPEATVVGLLKKNHERAMFAVMVDVEKLVHGHENGFAKYSYASVDQFYKAVRPLCVLHGVRWKAREWARPTVAGNTILYHFSIDLHFTDGHQYRDYDRVTVPMSLTGPQVSGAAKSYAMKAFMRATFLMETGEPDGDEQHPDGIVTGGPARDMGAKRLGPYNRRSAANRTEDGLHDAIQGAADLQALDAILRDRRAEFDALKATDWSQHARVMKAVEDRRNAMTESLRGRGRRENTGAWPPQASVPVRHEDDDEDDRPPPKPAGRPKLDDIERNLIRDARACRDLRELTDLWRREEATITTLGSQRNARVMAAFSARRAEVEQPRRRR